MEFIYLFVGLVIGLLVGVLMRKQLSASEQQLKQMQQQVEQSEQSLQQYQQDVASHLENSTQLLSQMQQACSAAMVQMEQSTRLLDRANQRTSDMPFFSAEADAHLRANPEASKRTVRSSVTDLTEAPRDYADDPSGLFGDEKQVVTNNAS
ncbi:ZapG family protein [Thalassotalea maritima]|uniref:ZapG family protein n=1 Tax=Thalassotalea maritima TaxID=3242416 RepID=UPI003528AC5E